MKTNNIIVFILSIIIATCLPAVAISANDNITLGEQTENAVNGIGKAVSSAGQAISSTSKSVGEYADDSVITAKVKKQLFDALSINSFDISVNTENGIVTLAGFVPSQALAVKTVQMTLSVEGVKRVNDMLHVQLTSEKTIKGYITDTSITSELKANLLAEKGLSSLSVNVKTVNGIVQLSGYVSDPDQRTRVEDLAWKVTGVKSVKNDLLVKNQ